MVFIFSLDCHMPAYFRMVAGSISDVSSIVLTVKEAEIHNVVVIGDKGLYSGDNILALDKERIHYIFPLKRDSSLIDYTELRQGNKKAFDGFFLFEKRVIWYHSYYLRDGALKGKRIIIFLDDRLKVEEEKDYLSRIEESGDQQVLETFYEIQYRMGTISLITDLDENEERIYNLLKGRAEIEAMFDAFKNVLNADRTYVRDDYQMEGWMLINFIALVFYYKIYRLLAEKSLLRNYSPKDILIHLSRIYKLKIQDQWLTSEIPKKTRNIMEKLKLPPIT